MRIIINYEASWRNSFLSGSNNEPLQKKGRDFIASMTTLKKDGNFIRRKVTKDTVMGILNRLIGDQRKLYQSRQSKDYIFKDIEKNLKDSDIRDDIKFSSSEIVYIRNISGSTDQNAFTGMVKANDPAFNSDFSQELWGVLFLSLEEVLDFIEHDFKIICNLELDPLVVITRLEELGKLKAFDADDKGKKVLAFLKEKFHSDFHSKEGNPLDNNTLLPRFLYTSALYIQIERLKNHFYLDGVLTKSGGLSGISKRGFTKKDFMEKYTTGGKKIIWGNPYLLKERVKGMGEVVSMLEKASGKLEIKLDISKEEAINIHKMIENAGVSSFYMGKKGLAYVEDIRY